MHKLIVVLVSFGIAGCAASTSDSGRAAGNRAAGTFSQTRGPFEIYQVKRAFNDAETEEDWTDTMVVKLNKLTRESWILFPLDGVPGRDDDSNDHSMSWIPVPEYVPEFLHATPKGKR